MDVAKGLTTAEAAVIDFIDWYEFTGELLEDPDRLKDKLREICSDDFAIEHDFPLSVLVLGADTAELLVFAIEKFWAAAFRPQK